MHRHGSASLHGRNHWMGGPWPDPYVNVPHGITVGAGGSGASGGSEECQAGENGRVSMVRLSLSEARQRANPGRGMVATGEIAHVCAVFDAISDLGWGPKEPAGNIGFSTDCSVTGLFQAGAPEPYSERSARWARA